MRKFHSFELKNLFLTAFFIICLGVSKPVFAAEIGNWVTDIQLSKSSFAFGEHIQVTATVKVNEALLAPPQQGDRAQLEYDLPYRYQPGVPTTLLFPLTYNAKTKLFEGTLSMPFNDLQVGLWEVNRFVFYDSNNKLIYNSQMLADYPNQDYYQDLSAGNLTMNIPVHGWNLVEEEYWYYFDDAKGRFLTGWVYTGGKWYYLSPEYWFMEVGWIENKGNWYFLDRMTGAMKTGWIFDDAWYYTNKSGALQAGWVYDRGKWYFMYPDDGTMATGWISVKGKWYFFYNNGSMAANAWLGNYWVDSTGAWTKTRN